MKLLWPIKGREEGALTQGFGGDRDTYAPQQGHNGLDFRAGVGEEIRATYDGYIIERISKDTGFGKRISQKLFADGRWWFVVYAHQSKFVRPDEFEFTWNRETEFVKKGQVIGYSGDSGFSTGPHMHFGLYPMNVNGTNYLNNGYGGAVDPLSYLKGLPMVYFAHVEGTSEYGFVEESPYTKVFYRGVNEPDIKFQAAKFGLTITKVDGSINFALAKDIRI